MNTFYIWVTVLPKLWNEVKHLAARDMDQEKGSLWEMNACLTHFQNRAMQVNHMISRVKIMEGLPIFLGWGYHEEACSHFLFVKKIP